MLRALVSSSSLLSKIVSTMCNGICSLFNAIIVLKSVTDYKTQHLGNLIKFNDVRAAQ